MSSNPNRYSVSPSEDFEPGSNDLVLKNLLGVISVDEMNALEESELERAESEIINYFTKQHKFTVADICNIHDLWLGDIYSFAGKYRKVNMSKDGFPFASADRIDYLMTKFEEEFLAKLTPCSFTTLDELAYALGSIHVELILIHPFREGNGRIARLLADLMVIQTGRMPLNFQYIDKTLNPQGFKQYILAIHEGVDGNYEPIKEIFKLLFE